MIYTLFVYKRAEFTIFLLLLHAENYIKDG